MIFLKALITGASSGIGRSMAICLAQKNIDLIIVARREEKLLELKNTLDVDVKVIKADLSKNDECFKLYEIVKNENINILINNAGFGICGDFLSTDLNKEIQLINTNITAVHILTKLFLKDFASKNSGFIMNVASSAAFLPGPLLSSYYASKSYVLRLGQAINEELKRNNSNIRISTLCPGPVKTEFDKVANVKFSINGLSSDFVAKYAIDKMFAKKEVILPGYLMKILRPFQKFLPEKILTKAAYKIQRKKLYNN